MTRQVFRFVPLAVEQDESAETTYEAECVSGYVTECGAESGPCPGPERVEDWMRRHAQNTGHRRYLRIFSDHAVVRLSEEPSAPARANGGTA